ncbi:MAG: hypothetical protein RB292_01665 [Patescibacteria group bacterium]|jgi:hypothetical protein|nr:hypothetical protein [Patescibacteria group bacterium]
MSSKPVKVFHGVKPPWSGLYEHLKISLSSQGGEEVLCLGDRLSTTGRWLEFSRAFGVGGSCRCLAIRVNGSLEIFEGNTTGPGILNIDQILQDHGLGR